MFDSVRFDTTVNSAFHEIDSISGWWNTGADEEGGNKGDTPTGDNPAGERPNIIVGVATTDATVPDARMTDPIHAALARRALLPAEHYLDSGYPSA